MKRLFDENDRYTEEAVELDRAVEVTLKPIYETYIEMGYSIREISHVILEAVVSYEARRVIETAVKKRKEEKKLRQSFGWNATEEAHT